MKLKLFLIILVVACLLVPQYAGAATVLDETGFITRFGGENYKFVADQEPLVYEVTLTDLEFPGAFNILGVAITTSTENVTELLATGSKTFDVELGETYFANVLGLTDKEYRVGLFGIKIAPVPIPPSLILLSSSVLGLVLLRRRGR